MHPALLKKRDKIVAACRRFDVTRLDIFGSGARGVDFDPARSDADFLVDLGPLDSDDIYLDLKEAFERILGRHVDLVDRKALDRSRHYIRRRHILAELEPIYVA